MRGAATSESAGSQAHPAGSGDAARPGGPLAVLAERAITSLGRGVRYGRRLAVALPGRATAAADAFTALWRQSLQLRVVATTLVTSGVVVTLLGWFLMSQIASAVLQTEAQRAGSLAAAGVLTAEAQPWVSSSPGAQSDSQMYALTAAAPGQGRVR